VIRLVKYIRVPRAEQRKISRRALFARDDGAASTAGRPAGGLTLDHVLPRSRGGDSVWENVVTACAPCNLKKGDRLPEEASMTMKRLPRPPAPVLFIRLAAPSACRPVCGSTWAPRSPPRSRCDTASAGAV